MKSNQVALITMLTEEQKQQYIHGFTDGLNDCKIMSQNRPGEGINTLSFMASKSEKLMACAWVMQPNFYERGYVDAFQIEKKSAGHTADLESVVKRFLHRLRKALTKPVKQPEMAFEY